MRRLRNQSGQSAVLLVLFIFVIIGMVGAVLDVGAWFRADRQTQSTADAAALAGAQELPDDPGLASEKALDYASKNGGGVSPAGVSFSSTVLPNDTIGIRAADDAPTFFTKLFGFDSVSVGSVAKARAGVISSAKYVAPIVVNYQHPMLQCTPPPCQGPTEIDLMNLHNSGGSNGAGAFGLINLDSSASDGNEGASTVADWMESGFPDAMNLGWYYQVPSSQFNNGQFESALEDRLNTEVLFPIYKQLVGQGQNARYQVIGWVGFVPTKFDASGSNGKVYGSFKRVIWQGIPSTDAGQQSFGAYAVQLIQ